MRPRHDAAGAKVVGIGNDLALGKLRLLDAIGDAVACGVGDRLLLAVEAQKPVLQCNILRREDWIRLLFL